MRLALATSRALFLSAPAVVLTGVADEDGLAKATSTAVDLGVPVLLTPTPDDANAGGELRSELERLKPHSVLTIGDAAASWAGGTSSVPATAITANVPVGDVAVGAAGLPDITPAAPLEELLVLALNQPASRAAVATAKASGARVVLMADPDPRTSGETIKALAGQDTSHVLALGSSFGSPQLLRARVDTAATGVQLPGGGQVVFPGRRMVAIYGHPASPGMGALGQQSLNGAVARAKQLAASYSPLVDEPVVPAFEIIATVYAGSAGSDGNYSIEWPVAKFQPWVDAARAAGMYVMLDLQPGKADFLTQAKIYEPLLKQPNVGLALDPEWRRPDGMAGGGLEIGHVSAAEINRTADWLAELTRKNKLPQKILILHEFKSTMITDRQNVDTSHDELRIVIHVDGHGSPGSKLGTWHAIRAGAPAGIWWGWKNFITTDQADTPPLTPEQTVAVKPSPVFISYQ